MRGFVRRAAREMRGSRTVGDKGQLRGSEGQPVYAGLLVCAGVPGRCRGRDVSLPAVTTKAPGSKDRGARVCVSSCYALHRRLMEQLSRAIPVLLEDWSLVPLS